MPKDTQLVRNLNPDSMILKVIFFTTISPEESDACGNSPGQTISSTIEEFERGRVVSAELKEVRLVLGSKRWEGSA